MVAAGTADTEEDIFTTQATTATAVAGVTTAVASIHGGYCRSLSRFRILPTADTDMVPVPATADTGRAMVPGTVTGTESRTRTGLGSKIWTPSRSLLPPRTRTSLGKPATQRHVQDQLGDRGPNRQGTTNSSPQALCKTCALVAVTLVLPALAYAGNDNGKGNDYNNNGNGNGRHIPVVPETNPAWILVPFFGAVLLFSSRRFLSANLAKK